MAGDTSKCSTITTASNWSAGFDVGEQARTAAAADFGMRVTASAEELITDPNVHVVYIATPPLYHEVYVDQVQAAGV